MTVVAVETLVRHADDPQAIDMRRPHFAVDVAISCLIERLEVEARRRTGL